MSHGRQKITAIKHISLLLVEGETDEIFYKRIKTEYLNEVRVKIENLKGLFNINKKIIDKIQNKKETRVYCCVDRESRYGQVPGLDLKIIKKYIKENNLNQILSIDSIIATRQIESWFFYDIEGIFKFLKTPRSKRNPSKYKIPQRFCKKDLQRLFADVGKVYIPGERAENFIMHLDISKIVSKCKELTKGINLIKAQSKT